MVFYFTGSHESVPLMGASRHQTQQVLGDKHQPNAVNHSSVWA